MNILEWYETHYCYYNSHCDVVNINDVGSDIISIIIIAAIDILYLFIFYMYYRQVSNIRRTLVGN